MRKPTSAKKLSDEFGLKVGNVSYHLSKVLYQRCRLIKVVERNQRRGATETVYGPRPEMIRCATTDASDLVQLIFGSAGLESAPEPKRS